jgi:hypothetical protein
MLAIDLPPTAEIRNYTGSASKSEQGNSTTTFTIEGQVTSLDTRRTFNETNLRGITKPSTNQLAQTTAGIPDAVTAASSSGLRMPNSTMVPSQKRSLAASTSVAESQRILRKHFVERILAELQRLQASCGQPTAAVYADSLLRNMREMRDLSQFDPILEVIMALHDALAFENRWMTYDADQLAKAHDLLQSLQGRKQVDSALIDKTIVQLESLGFDTTPFGEAIDFDTDE